MQRCPEAEKRKRKFGGLVPALPVTQTRDLHTTLDTMGASGRMGQPHAGPAHGTLQDARSTAEGEAAESHSHQLMRPVCFPKRVLLSMSWGNGAIGCSCQGPKF